MTEELDRISHELAKIEQGQVKAFADDDRVLIMVQNAPEELRKLAEALEKLNINEIQAMIAYTLPKTAEASDSDDSSGESDEDAADE